jgi:hypothetical protein
MTDEKVTPAGETRTEKAARIYAFVRKHFDSHTDAGPDRDEWYWDALAAMLAKEIEGCPPPAAQPVERVAGEAEVLARDIVKVLDEHCGIVGLDPHAEELYVAILPILSEALAAASESDLHHAECKALIEEQRDALAARLREAEAVPATAEPSEPCDHRLTAKGRCGGCGYEWDFTKPEPPKEPRHAFVGHRLSEVANEVCIVGGCHFVLPISSYTHYCGKPASDPVHQEGR